MRLMKFGMREKRFLFVSISVFFSDIGVTLFRGMCAVVCYWRFSGCVEISSCWEVGVGVIVLVLRFYVFFRFVEILGGFLLFWAGLGGDRD